MKDFDESIRSLTWGFLPPEPRLEFLYRIVVDCNSPIDVGAVEKGRLKIIPITGGRFEGPKIRGTVLPLGADWNTSRYDKESYKSIDTRYVLRTDDCAVISLSTRGFVRQTPDVMAAQSARTPVDPSKYYFRQHLFFETSAEKYDWLNTAVAFGIVISKSTPGVVYDAYCVF